MTFKHLIIGTTTALLLASPAFAHSPIKQANITAGSTYNAAPESFNFSFAKTVGLSKISLSARDGANLALNYTKPASMQKSFSVPLPRLTRGDYILSWSAVATDGHVMKGDISFTIGGANPKRGATPEQHGNHKGH